MPKAKRMKNNASSVLRVKKNLAIPKSVDDGPDSSTLLISKHKQLRKNYLNLNGDADDFNYVTNVGPSPKSSPDHKICHKFLPNKDINKILTKSSFPSRFPTKVDNDSSLTDVAIQESGEDLIPVLNSSSKMTKLFIKFWNKVVTKQDMSTTSVLDHQLTDQEAGYFPCQLKTLFASPESYLKKSYCSKGRYTGNGYQFLPGGNHFMKISSRTEAKLEVKRIFDHYSNHLNQYFLIPIEFSSKLSRCMLSSIEICQQSQGANKIKFASKLQQSEKHPILAIEYQSSVELETLPSKSMSFVENFSCEMDSSSTFKNKNLEGALTIFPYLSHFLQRSDFWVDDFYSKCWHFSRYFCDKLVLGNRIRSAMSVLVKDSLFKFLISCSARICVAIKYWVLNPEGATYFRCRCGQKMYDSKQESKVLNKFQIGTANLFNFQQKLKEQDSFHNKHGDLKSSSHICACGEQFTDHKLWTSHIFSTKVFDLSRICPVFIYFFAQNSLQENRYFCECDLTFSDYDFWSFWLHACNCNVLKSAIKSNCRCNSSNKIRKEDLQMKISSEGVKPVRRGRGRPRTKASSNHRSRSIVTDDDDKKTYSAEMETLKISENGPNKIEEENSDDNWLSGDNKTLSGNVLKQNNFNNYVSKPLKRKRR